MAENIVVNGNRNYRLAEIPVSKIQENPEALRGVQRKGEDFDLLKSSIAQRGITNPIVVREMRDPTTGEEYYGLIDGLQRFTAASELGHDTVPANIIDADEAQTLELQLISNARRIETKKADFAKALQRILDQNPTMTKQDLATRLNISPTWIDALLNLNKKLHPDLRPLVNEGVIKINNAIELSKLPPEEQLQNSDLAQTANTAAFSARVTARVKELKEARRQGRDAGPQEFVPQPLPRKPVELREEYDTPKAGPSVIKHMGAKSALDGWNAAIKWVLQMDPTSVELRKKHEEDRLAKQKAAADKRKAEREEKKKAAAAENQAALMEASTQ